MIPSYFIAHGSPMIVTEENQYTDFLKELAEEIPSPKAILVFSAHYEAQKQKIGAVADQYDMIYDFYGFAEDMYYLQYPAKGNRELAVRIKDLLNKNGIESYLDKERGLDHGTWTILKLMYPEANIPVIPLSLNPFMTPQEQYNLGKAISILKDEDILIIGSGGIVHNLSQLNPDAEQAEAWAVEFDDWVYDKVTQWNLEELFKYEQLAPNSKRAVPRPEHFVTLFLAMGAGDEKRKAILLKKVFEFGNLALNCYKFE